MLSRCWNSLIKAASSVDGKVPNATDGKDVYGAWRTVRCHPCFSFRGCSLRVSRSVVWKEQAISCSSASISRKWTNFRENRIDGFMCWSRAEHPWTWPAPRVVQQQSRFPRFPLPASTLFSIFMSLLTVGLLDMVSIPCPAVLAADWVL